MKINRLALAAFICALLAILSLAIYWMLFSLSTSSPPQPGDQFLTGVMDFTVPLRNLSAVAAIVMGILALSQIRKKGGSRRDRWFAWLAILLGGGWLLFGMLVGAVFLLPLILQ